MSDVYCALLVCCEFGTMCEKCEKVVCGAHHNSGTGIIFDPIMMLHKCHSRYPERPERIYSIWQRFQQTGLAAQCVRVAAREATFSELTSVHSEEHLTMLSAAYGMTNITALQKELFDKVGFRLCGDIFFSSGTTAAAKYAAGSVVEMCARVISGSLANGFAIVRPPGHHAEANVAQGLCFLNNVALAALLSLGRRLHDGEVVERVLIVDWDVHHGNGSQDILYRTKQVLYSSLHHYGKGFYPGTGHMTDVGSGEGEGYNINVCLEEGAGDADYLAAFQSVLMPIYRDYNPQLVIVSAGFDACDGDVIGGMKVSPHGFAEMTRQLCELANGKVVLALEVNKSSAVCRWMLKVIFFLLFLPTGWL